jgi:hypothetical protein
VTLPASNAEGDLPVGVHACLLRELLDRFGSGSSMRRVMGRRLRRVVDLVALTGHSVRIIVFGSFVSETEEPNDVDLFLIMDDAFDLNAVSGEGRLVFDHATAQAHFGASVFWVRQSACFPNEVEMVAGWGLKRDGSIRGIVELMKEST